MPTEPSESQARIRSASEDDLPQIQEIEELSFEKNWDYYNFKASLNDVFLVFEEGNIIGFLIACCCRVAYRGLIIRIAVHPGHRGKGIASALVESAMQQLRNMHIREVELDVDIVKPNAIRLYEKLGFHIDRVISPDHNEDDSFYMMKKILEHD